MTRLFAPTGVLHGLHCLGLLWMGVANATVDASSVFSADASGMPQLTRFGAEHYSVMPQHSAVTSDASGRIFVGNVEGLLIYAAGRFEHVPAPQELSIRSLALVKDGRVLVGGFDQFGHFTEQNDGSWVFTDLDERFRAVPEAHPIGQVWLVAALRDGMYVQGDRRLFRIDNEGHADSWPNPAKAMTALEVDGEIWVRFSGLGLMRFTGDGFDVVPGGGDFIDSGVQSSAPHPQGTLFTSRQRGLFLGDAQGLRHMPTAFDEWLTREQPYSVAALADGDFAIATLSGEVAIVDGALQLKRRFRISNYPITEVTQSVDGGLWFATEGDLVRMEWPSPWTFVGEEDGLFGALNDAEWFEGSRWVATSLGLFHSITDGEGRVAFAAQPGVTEEIWDLQPFADELLVGERRSVLSVHQGVPRKIADSTGAFELIVSQHQPGQVLVLEDTSILELRRDDSWRVGARHDLGDVSVSTLVELDADHWLIGNWRGYPQLLSRTSASQMTVTALDAAAGFGADASAGSSVWKLDETVYATIGDDLYQRQGERFVQLTDHPLLKLAGKRVNEVEFRSGKNAQYAFSSRDAWRITAGNWQPLSMQSRRSVGLSELSIDQDDRVTIVGWGGLLTYNPALDQKRDAAFKLRMHRVVVSDLKRNSHALDRTGAAMLDIPPLDSLRFEYGINGHDTAVEYRSRLASLEGGEWSEWSNAMQREFGQLPPGDYRMQVEARARSGQVGSSALDFPFRVLPRWYQTRAAAWAGAGLVLAIGSLLAWSWGRYRSRKLSERNIELEREVAVHTRDLEVANQRLSKLAVQDGLTGITNRRGFEQFFARTWNRLAEQRLPMAVLMVDVDFFKQYNDQHGHLLGDEMLRGIAAQLELEVHEPDELLARFGGEEFVLVLPNVEIEAATSRAHALRSRCEDFGRSREVTVSVGVSACVPRGGLKATQLIDEADAALYRAKKLGRNRVERGRTL
jgi:diguanylate cyclase (GGDEF)-like protein